MKNNGTDVPMGDISMSRSKHTNKKKAPAAQPPVRPSKPVRVRLTDWRSGLLTILLVIACLSAIMVMQVLGWFDTVPGSLLLIVLGFFTCALLFDIGLIFSAGITVADGAVNAGKDKAGTVLVFHCDSVSAIELRDGKTDEPLAETAKSYRRVRLTFVMNGGRVNQRDVNFITQKQLDAVRKAVMG